MMFEEVLERSMVIVFFYAGIQYMPYTNEIKELEFNVTMLLSFCLKRCLLSDSGELRILPNRSKTAFEENRTTVHRGYTR